MPHNAVKRCPEIIRIIRIASTSADKFWRINIPDRKREPTICNSNVSCLRTERDTTRRVCNCPIKRIVFSQEPLINEGPSWLWYVQQGNPNATIGRANQQRIIIGGEGNLQCLCSCWVLIWRTILPVATDQTLVVPNPEDTNRSQLWLKDIAEIRSP